MHLPLLATEPKSFPEPTDTCGERRLRDCRGPLLPHRSHSWEDQKSSTSRPWPVCLPGPTSRPGVTDSAGHIHKKGLHRVTAASALSPDSGTHSQGSEGGHSSDPRGSPSQPFPGSVRLHVPAAPLAHPQRQLDSDPQGCWRGPGPFNQGKKKSRLRACENKALA